MEALKTSAPDTSEDSGGSIAGSSPEELAWRGIELCRRGDWHRGFYWLSLAASETVDATVVPSLYFAYLGHGLARLQGEADEGLRLCRRAIELEPYQPESYACMARTLLLAGDRRTALDVTLRGLQVDASHDGLKALKLELGERRAPVIRRLPRHHVLNRTLGRLRHWAIGPRPSR